MEMVSEIQFEYMFDFDVGRHLNIVFQLETQKPDRNWAIGPKATAHSKIRLQTEFKKCLSSIKTWQTRSWIT